MTSVSAVGQTRTMIVTGLSSESTPIGISTETRISFSGDHSKMIVSSDGESDPVSFDIDDIACIVFSLDSSVDRVSPDLDGVVVSNRGGIVTLSGAERLDYSAWDAAGHLVMQGSAGQTATLDFTGKPAGVYIIRVNNKTVKFINR